MASCRGVGGGSGMSGCCMDKGKNWRRGSREDIACHPVIAMEARNGLSVKHKRLVGTKGKLETKEYGGRKRLQSG